MKRFQKLAALCAVCTLLTGTAAVLPCSPAAAAVTVSAVNTVTENDVVYTLYEDHAEVSRYTGEASLITLPETMQGLPVTALADGAFQGKLLRHIDLPAGLQQIGTEAFAECERLVVVTFPESLEEIGEDAFRGTFWLNQQRKTGEPVIAGNVLIDAVKCRGTVRIPNGVTEIAKGAFRNNTALTGVRIPVGVKRIGAGAFAGCTALAKLDLPSGLEEIPEEMCDGCTALEYVRMPLTLQRIGRAAFRDSGLQYVDLPAAVHEIEPETFYGCRQLYSFAGYNLYSIGARAFADCENLYSLESCWRLETIGDEAFAGCSRLMNFATEGNLTFLGKGAFRDCILMHSVMLPQSVKGIGDEAFAGCPDIEQFFIYGIFTEIGKQIVPDSPNVVIFAYEGSTAQKYAEENGLSFVPVSDFYAAKPGNANGDNQIDVEDAQFVLSVYTERMAGHTFELPQALETAADVDEDGAITVKDAQYILRYYTECIVACKTDISWISIIGNDWGAPF